MAETSSRIGYYVIPDALRRNPQDKPVPIYANDFDGDGKPDLFIRGDTRKRVLYRDLQPDYENLFRNQCVNWSQFSFHPFSDKQFPEYSFPEKIALGALGFVAEGVAAMLSPAKPLLSCAPMIVCNSGDVDCEQIDRACKMAAPWRVTDLVDGQKIFEDWKGDSHSPALFREAGGWDPKRKGLQWVVADKEGLETFLVFKSIEDTSEFSLITPWKGSVSNLTTVESGAIFLNSSGHGFPLSSLDWIDENGEERQLFTFQESLWKVFEGAEPDSLDLFFHYMKLPEAKFIFSLKTVKKEEGEWKMGEERVVTLAPSFIPHDVKQASTHDLWVWGVQENLELAPGATNRDYRFYKIKNTQQPAMPEVSEQGAIVQALRDFFKAKPEETAMSFIGLNPRNDRPLFLVEKIPSDDVTMDNFLDKMSVGLLEIDPDTLKVRQVLNMANLVEYYNVTCKSDAIIEYASEHPEIQTRVMMDFINLNPDNRSVSLQAIDKDRMLFKLGERFLQIAID